MKINILSSIDKRPSGVNRNLIEFGNYLFSKGHEVYLIKAIDRGYYFNRRDRIEKKIAKFLYGLSGRRIKRIRKLPWIDLKCPAITILSFNEKYLPASDITFFSFEYHLPIVEKLSEKYGKKVFRVCDIFFAENVRYIPENIYLTANSTLVKKLLEERLKREVFLLLNSVNTKIFNNPDKREKVKTIGMFFYNKKPKHKGMEDGFWVMEQLYKKYPYLKFKVIGEWRENWIPEFVEFYDGNKIENLINFYRNTDIFIYTSKKDACPNPPMEAMACKCALVTTEVGAIPDYTEKDKSAIVVNVGDREGILKGVINLVENNDYFKKISEEGYKKIQEFSIEKQGEKLEKFLYTIIENE